jgi:hypothetical protein
MRYEGLPFHVALFAIDPLETLTLFRANKTVLLLLTPVVN